MTTTVMEGAAEVAATATHPPAVELTPAELAHLGLQPDAGTAPGGDA